MPATRTPSTCPVDVISLPSARAGVTGLVILGRLPGAVIPCSVSASRDGTVYTVRECDPATGDAVKTCTVEVWGSARFPAFYCDCGGGRRRWDRAGVVCGHTRVVEAIIAGSGNSKGEE